MLLATDDPEVLDHLAEALRDHLQRCQAAGRSIPVDVVRLASYWTVAARRGLERPTLPDRSTPAETSAQDADVLDYAAAARRLSVSTRTVRRMVADGRLPAVRAGRAVRIPVAAIDAWTGVPA